MSQNMDLGRPDTENGNPLGDPGRLPCKEIPAILLAGGMSRGNPSAIPRMMSHAFRDLHKPLAAYIGTANGDNPAFFQMMKFLLKRAGAGKVVFVHLAKNKPDLEAARNTLAKADLIFLAGGEVEDGMYWLEKHGLVSLLGDLYGSGKRFLGVSAGVIMMGTHWVHWDIPQNDSTSRLFNCIRIIPALFDVHGEDEDWAELKTALRLLGKGSRGYGLPSECMISADSQGTLVNLSGKYLVFANKGGEIRLL